MKVVKERRDGVVIFTLKGEFDSFVTKPFTEEIAKVLQEGPNRLVLNLLYVKYINSTALGAMIKARKSCLEAGGNLVVSRPSPAVREAMESLGLDKLFTILDDDDAAVETLAAPPPSGS
jgi:anti-sigma B factor antagonist